MSKVQIKLHFNLEAKHLGKFSLLRNFMMIDLALVSFIQLVYFLASVCIDWETILERERRQRDRETERYGAWCKRIDFFFLRGGGIPNAVIYGQCMWGVNTCAIRICLINSRNLTGEGRLAIRTRSTVMVSLNPANHPHVVKLIPLLL